jgi:hypothetical protein
MDAYFKLNYPADQFPIIVAAYCSKYKYNPKSGKTPGEFTTQKIIDEISHTVSIYKLQEAVKISQAAIKTEQDAIASKVTVEYKVEQEAAPDAE